MSPSECFVSFHLSGQWPWLLFISTGLLSYVVLEAIYLSFFHPLSKLPGHWLARFSRFYKLYLVYGGNVHSKSIAIHKKYGPIVRTGPFHVSVSDPAAIPTIYGVASKFVKSDFYKCFGGRFEGSRMDNLFSTRDPAEHKYLKVPVSQMFSMSSIRQFEPMADECSAIFMSAMHELQGQVLDFGVWLQWYAFDVIAAMTFQARFGFMESRKDVQGMIGAIEKALMYGAMVGQVPSFHAWLLGNDFMLWLMKILAPNTPNPVSYIINVGHLLLPSIHSVRAKCQR